MQKMKLALLVMYFCVSASAEGESPPESLNEEKTSSGKPNKTSKISPSGEIGPRCFDCLTDWLYDDSSSEEEIIIINTPSPPTTCQTPPPPVCPTQPTCPPPVVCPPPPPPATCAPPVVCPQPPPPTTCTPPTTDCDYKVTTVIVDEDDGSDVYQFCVNPFGLFQDDGSCLAIKIMKKGIQIVVQYLDAVLEKISIPGTDEFPDCIEIPEFYPKLPGFCVSLDIERRNSTFLHACASMHFKGFSKEGQRISCFKIRR